MKTKFVPLCAATAMLVSASSLQAAISLLDGVAYTQNFNSLASTGTSSTLPTDWVLSESDTAANTTYTVGTGSLATGDTYSFGLASNSDRALGTLLSGSLVSTIGASFKNDVGAATIDLTIVYTGEQWRLGATSRVDRLDFQYSLNATSLTTGTWTDVNSLDFTAPITSGTLGAFNGNLTANRTSISSSITGLAVTSGATFWIRWSDFNSTGSDDGLAVDDFSITAVPETSTSLLGLLGVLGLLWRRRM